MTLLVVLGIVVIATILAALYLSLRSARGGGRESALGSDGTRPRGRQARGASRSGRPPAMADRLRSLAGRGKGAAASSGSGRGDRRDRGYADPRTRSRGRGDGFGRDYGDGFDRDSLVPAGAGQRGDVRVAGSPTGNTRPPGGARSRHGAGGFPDDDVHGDDTDPAFRGGYGRGGAGYDGYDGAADTQLSSPVDDGAAGRVAYRGYGGGAPGGYPGAAGPSFTPTGPSFTPTDPAGPADGTEVFGRGGAGRDRDGGAARGSRGAGFADGDLDATSAGYGRGDRPGGYGTGPSGRPDSPRGRHPEPPAGGYPGSEDDATGPNLRYGADDRNSPAGRPGRTGRAGERGSGAARSAGRAGSRAGRDQLDTDPALRADSPFPPAADPRPGSGGDDGDRDESRGTRRRVGKIQRPHIRLRREKPDYDNDPWPGAEEEGDGVSDEQFWADMSTDKPLATTARTAQAGAGTDWPGQADAPGQGPAGDDPGNPATAEFADRPAPARGRRGRRRDAAESSGTEPNPYQGTDSAPPAGGRRRKDDSGRRSRDAEEDPLTSASYSRYAREANDSRSYRSARESRRPGAHGRPDSTMADTQALMRGGPDGPGAPGTPGFGPPPPRPPPPRPPPPPPPPPAPPPPPPAPGRSPAGKKEARRGGKGGTGGGL